MATNDWLALRKELFIAYEQCRDEWFEKIEKCMKVARDASDFEVIAYYKAQAEIWGRILQSDQDMIMNEAHDVVVPYYIRNLVVELTALVRTGAGHTIRAKALATVLDEERWYRRSIPKN